MIDISINLTTLYTNDGHSITLYTSLQYYFSSERKGSFKVMGKLWEIVNFNGAFAPIYFVSRVSV